MLKSWKHSSRVVVGSALLSLGLTSGPFVQADEAFKLKGTCYGSAKEPLQVRLSKSPKARAEQLSALIFLLNSSPKMGSEILKRSEVKVDDNGIATVPVCADWFPSIERPKSETQDEYRHIPGPHSFRMIVASLLEKNRFYGFHNDYPTLLDLYERTQRPPNPMLVSAWALQAGTSEILQDDATRLIEIWANEWRQGGTLLLSHDFGRTTSLDEIRDNLEAEFEQRGQWTGARYRPVIATAHEMLEVLPNGFFTGYLYDSGAKLADNAPLTVVKSSADIRHPLFSCLQCHGNGSITNASQTLSKFDDANKAILSSDEKTRRSLAEYYRTNKEYFSLEGRLSATNADYKAKVSDIDVRYAQALVQSEATEGPQALYHYFNLVSGLWPIEEVADEFDVSVEEMKSLLAASPTVPKDFADKGLPLGYLVERPIRTLGGFSYSHFYLDLKVGIEERKEEAAALANPLPTFHLKEGRYNAGKDESGTEYWVEMSRAPNTRLHAAFHFQTQYGGSNGHYRCETKLTCLNNLCTGLCERELSRTLVIEILAESKLRLKRMETKYRTKIDEWRDFELAEALP